MKPPRVEVAPSAIKGLVRMRRTLAAVVAFVMIGAGIAWSQGAIPGGHEAFLYWFNGTAWTPVQSSSGIPVGPSPNPTTDASGTIATGGTFQPIAAANTARQSFEFVNICGVTSACTATTNYCYLFFAASGSPSKTTDAIPVAPGASYLRSSGSIPSDAIQATCDGTGDHFRLAVQ